MQHPNPQDADWGHHWATLAGAIVSPHYCFATSKMASRCSSIHTRSSIDFKTPVASSETIAILQSFFQLLRLCFQISTTYFGCFDLPLSRWRVAQLVA